MNKFSIEVNGVEWSERVSRVEKPCRDCGILTRGRIGREALCYDHGLARVMKPLQLVKSILQEMFK
jgi:hypothetical protein